MMWEREGSPPDWEILSGSVLDDDFVDAHLAGRFDVVYSYGVLHHTGNTMKAIHNAGRALSPNGVLHIALYAHEWVEDVHFAMARTKEYNTAGTGRKYEMEVALGHFWISADLYHGVDPFANALDGGWRK